MDLIVHHVDLLEHPGFDEFVATVEVVVDGESQMISHGFPADVFETRAAEYDIPISDFNTLLDIVLYEPYLSDEDFDPSLSIHHADTVEEAREHHLARIAALKGDGQISGVTGESFDKRIAVNDSAVVDNSGADDPLEFIESSHLYDDDYHEVKQVYIANLREQQAALREEAPVFAAKAAKPVRRPRQSLDSLKELLTVELPGMEESEPPSDLDARSTDDTAG